MSKVPELYVGKSQNKGAYHKKIKFLKIPYTYLILQLDQIKILGQANTCPLKKMAFPYQIYGKNKDFRVFRQKYFLPSKGHDLWNVFVISF